MGGPPQAPDTSDRFLPKRMTGAEVGVALAGWVRASGPIGEDGASGYVLPLWPNSARGGSLPRWTPRAHARLSEGSTFGSEES